MSINEGSKITIIVAVIGFVGVLLNAVIGNWDKLFGAEQRAGRSVGTDTFGAGDRSPTTTPTPKPEVTHTPAPKSEDKYTRPPDVRIAAAPIITDPPCGSTVPWPADDGKLILNWERVKGAATYTLEVNCLQCPASQHDSPWRLRERLPAANPMYASNLHVELEKAGGAGLSWRVWGVHRDGRQGRKSEWCEVHFVDRPRRVTKERSGHRQEVFVGSRSKAADTPKKPARSSKAQPHAVPSR